MAKFKVLKTNQTYLNHVGISLDHSTSSTNSVFTFVLGYHVLISQIIALITSAAFIWKYPTDIKPALGALKIFIGVSQCIGVFVGIRMKVLKMKVLQCELQEIVDKGMSVLHYLIMRREY